MRIGKEKHERILTDTIIQLKDEGYTIIRTDGKSPTCIAFKDDESIAISIMKERDRTITELEDTYYMYDKIDRIQTRNKNRNDVTNEIINKYENDGYKIVILHGKCPDAIAFKGNKIFAIEILGKNDGYNNKKKVDDKADNYHMFDGVMVKTFSYNSDDTFTETFGNNEGGNR